jgi:hypothetical protein
MPRQAARTLLIPVRSGRLLSTSKALVGDPKTNALPVTAYSAVVDVPTRYPLPYHTQ